MPAVGDWVAVCDAPGDGAAIEAVLPRRTKFSRKTPWLKAEEHVLVANVDVLFLVAGLDRQYGDLIAILEETRAQLHAIGGMHLIEHEGQQLRVITVALHDRLCNVRVATPQGTTPEVLGCAACGFCYPPVSDDDQATGGNRG